jgi:hypothetical protein
MPNQQGQSLDLANVISVTVLPTPAQLGSPLINTIALFSRETPTGWTVGQTYGVYLDPASVATDFGINSNAYAIANAIFSQVPNPVETDGYLVIIPRLQSPSLESVRDAITRIGDTVYYYSVLIDEELAYSDPTEFGNLASMVHGLKKMLAYCSSYIADLEPNSVLDLIRQGSLFRVRTFYHGNALLNGASVQQTQIFAAAYAGRGLSVDFSGTGTAITMHGKALTGITPDQTIGQTQLEKAKTAGIDTYVSVAGIPMVFSTGANTFFDEVYNKDWLAMELQVAGFNYLIPTSFKIPQTNAGMEGLKGAYRKVCAQSVDNGVAAPGTWTAAVPPGIPQELFMSNIENVGYFVWSLPLSQQSTADRVARKAPLVQIALKLAGAIHSSNVLVQVNQ